MASFKLLNDLAIEEENNSRIDGLGFKTYAQVLGDAILGTQGPFTIGVFGEWGTGKTSLLHLAQSYLKENKNIVTVWFNAWRYEKDEHPIVPLLATIIKELQSNQTFTQSLANQGRDFINALRAVAYGFSSKSTVKIPGFAEIETSFVAKEMVDRAESLSNDPLLSRSLYYEAFERLSKIKIGEGKKIVIFVDDLDRCFPDLAIKLLESIKLVLSQSGFIFVLGVARTVIEGYLQHRYQEEYGLESFLGGLYLDKIVQLSFHIPPHHERVNQFCNCLLEQLDPSDKNIFTFILPTIANTTGMNPRATIRFVNNLLIDRAINNSLAETDGMDSIPIESFAVTRIIQQKWPEIFFIIIAYPELARELLTWKNKEILTEQSRSQNKDCSYLATRLLTDKQLSDLLFSKYGKNWLQDESIRNSSITFLKHRTQEAEGYREYLVSEYDVIVSYHNEDQEIVKYLIRKIQNAGISVTGIQTTFMEDRDNDFSAFLHNSKYFLICVGCSSSTEEDIRLVQTNIFKKLRESKKIIIILLPGFSFDQLPSEIGSSVLIDMRNGINEEGILPLIQLIKNL